MSRDLVAVAGALAQKPGYGGHSWALLQYVLGYRDLGWNVLFLDQMASSRSIDSAGQPCPVRDSINLRYLVDVMDRFGLSDRFALIVDGGDQWFGVDRGRVMQDLARCAFLLNIMGFLSHEDLLGAARRRVFLDIDPGFGQMWQVLGLRDVFVNHDAYVTIAERIGEPDCEIPTCGIDWVTTAQPVVLAYWPAGHDTSRTFTSVASWRGAFGPIEYRGKTYGLRAHEFRKFLDLPRRTGVPFEIALQIHPDETKDLDRLVSSGWTLVDPLRATADPWRYRDYIQAAGAEFMVAKNMYVQTRCGWLSDRSLCYLASGKPVLAQDTGWPSLYRIHEGLLSFGTIEQAEENVSAIVGDYARHSRAARAVAEEYFDSKKVLPKLLAALDVA